MFGLFKRKKRSGIDAVFESLDAQSVKGMGSVANVLLIQLLLCKNQPSYNAELHSKFVRGYLFGFFDAATQKLGLPHKSEEDAILRIIAGHSFFFNDQDINVFQYVTDSVGLQDDAIYKAAHQQGVVELYEYFDDSERRPFGLAKYFMDQKNR